MCHAAPRPDDSFECTNTKLRDEYPSLEELCRDLDLDRRALEDKMAAAGFSYDEARNAFR